MKPENIVCHWRPSGVVRKSITVAIPLMASCFAQSINAQQSDEGARRLYLSIPWKDGPATAQVGTVAEIFVPPGFRFAGAGGARQWAELMGNPPDEQCLGVLVPDSGDWYIDFDFNDAGYVPDEEKDTLDADALLQALRNNTEQSNQYRLQRGWSTLQVLGWRREPQYDSITNQLTWAIRCQSSGQYVVNYNSRLLGRSGVMSANLVVPEESFLSVLPLAKGLLTEFRFVSGQRYAEWRTGDKVAAYGLSALVVGGGTAVAAKTGFLAKAWKLIVLVIGGFLAWLGRAFSKTGTSSSWKPATDNGASLSDGP